MLMAFAAVPASMGWLQWVTVFMIGFFLYGPQVGSVLAYQRLHLWCLLHAALGGAADGGDTVAWGWSSSAWSQVTWSLSHLSCASDDDWAVRRGAGAP